MQIRWLPLVALMACHPPPASEPAPTTTPEPEPTAAPEAPTPTPAEPVAGDPRPADDIARDALRRPQEVMDFFGIVPGSRVVELLAGGGYYVDLLSRRVGPTGQVWAHNTPFVLDRFAREPITQRLANPALSNVQRLDTELEDPQLPADLDAVMMVLFYHDLYWQKVDREKMNAAIFAALRPGGVFGVIDHSAAKGRGSQDNKRLHRIEESLVIEEVTAAGFELAETSDLLRHPEDGLDYMVFSPPDGRDKTDRFVLKFVKPQQ